MANCDVVSVTTSQLLLDGTVFDLVTLYESKTKFRKIEKYLF